MSATEGALRAAVKHLTPNAQRPTPCPTGLDALDALLPGGGLPRGRLTELRGPRGSGKTTLLRGIVAAMAERGQWVAYVDARRTLAPRDWADVGSHLWVIRPREARKGAWCADILLRCGAFALVVLDGAPPLSRGTAVRLTRLARDAGAVLVVTGDEERPATVGSALRLRLTPGSAHRPGRRRPRDDAGQHTRLRRMEITVEKGGGGGGVRRTVEVTYAAPVARRLCTHTEVPDRRGVARERGKRGAHHDGRVTAESSTAGIPTSGRILARKRRCAEPDYGEEPRRAAARSLG
jgi:hypothetical protein